MKIYYLIILAAFIVISCSEDETSYDNDFNTLNNISIKEAVSLTNEWRTSKPKITSYVTTGELIVKFPDGREIKKALTTDEMYIAVAPYTNTTHECGTHYISKCQAELGGRTFSLTVTELLGNFIFNGDVTGMNNGFFEIWLPRGKTFELNISYNNLNVKDTITTNADSKTCITTMQLK